VTGVNSEKPLLGGYAAKQCARRVHNDFDLTIPRVEWEPPPVLQARFDAGLAFEADVFGRLQAALGDRCVDLSGTGGKPAAIAATVAAMDAGVELILGGWLPDDPIGGRTGKPDLLIRVDADGSGSGYIPGDVKGHKVTKAVKSKSLRWSRLSDPAVLLTAPGRAEEVSSRFDDFSQLAHYSRMLEACGRHPIGSPHLGVIIGTDLLTDLDESGLVLVWHDLDEPQFKTFSRSAPKGAKSRSATERYDHEHDFRVRIAETAQARTGAPDDPAPLVVPVFQEECESCPWYDWCLDDLGPGTASVDITSGRLDRREWIALDALGVHTTADLAAVDVADQAWLTRYVSEVTHRPDAVARLDVAVQRAAMVRNGEELRRITTGPLAVPAADVEIDLDIEWDAEDHVYLWGARLRHPGAKDATYHPFVTWDPITVDTEQALAEQFLAWLQTQIEAGVTDGRSILVFHYANPEPRYLTKILGADRVADVLLHFVDLLPLMRTHFLGAHGLSIKQAAPAFGFAWRDEDPGGLQAQLWLDEVRAAEDQTRRAALEARILNYNEDDVTATAALRDGLLRSPLSR
jgi:predicted RecB family nuclease